MVWDAGMQQDGQHGAQVSAEAVHKSIDELRRKLTVIVACAQMLQRQSQADGDVAPEMVEKRAAMIVSAATDMIKTLHDLENISSAERD